MSARNRGFELVSKYSDEFVLTEEDFNKQLEAHKETDGPEEVKRLFMMPSRGTKKSACYDIFNNTGDSITLAPGEMSGAITTYIKSYMLDDEVLMAFVRSGHGFKFSVRLANSTGIIDCDYYNNEGNEGEIFVKLHNQGEKTLVIPAGEAMAQFMFQKYLLSDDDAKTVGGLRAGGIGSTSKK
jgi:dUTP pyrophosphatase